MSDILRTITRACNQHGMAVTRFGRLAMGDPRFVLDLRNGREPRPAAKAKVLAFVATMGEARP